MNTNKMFNLIKFEETLLEYYKRLGLSEIDLSVLLMIRHLVKQDNDFVSAEQLSLKMSLPIGEIDKTLVSLMDRKFIEYNNVNKSLSISLEPTYKKLFKEFKKTIFEMDALENSEEKTNSLKNIYQAFEKELGRSLTPLEFSMINEWVNYGFSDTTIIDALKEAISNKKKSLRAVDKILLAWQTRDDRHEKGYSTASDKWNKDMEEAIKIAQTKWVEK